MLIDEFVIGLKLQPIGFAEGRAKQKQTLQQMKADASDLENQILAIRRMSTEKMSDEGRRRFRTMQADLAQRKKAIRDQSTAEKTADTEEAKRQKESVKRNKDIGAGLGDMTNKVLGLAAAFGVSVGLKDFIGSTITGNANLGRLATTLGVSTEQLSAWEGAVRQVGGTTEDAAAAIGLLVQSAQQVKLTGWSPIVPLLIREGISPADLNDPIKAYGELADKFHAMDPRQAASLGAMFSIPPSVVNLLIQGRQAMEAYMAAEAKAYPIHQKDAQAAQAAQRQISLLKDTYGRLGNDILNEALPGLIAFGGWTTTHEPEVVGALGGITAAMIAMNAAAIVGAAAVLAEAAPWIALGLAIAEAIKAYEQWQKLTPAQHRTSTLDRERDAAKHGHVVEHLYGGTLEATEAKDRGLVKPRSGETSGGLAVREIAQFEGFRPKAYWDRNAYRAGFGSDTMTDPKTGRVSHVTAGTSGITPEAASADLLRRVNTEFLPGVEKQIGLSAWNRLPQTTQAALISVDYNYGHLPPSVAAAAKSGNVAAVSKAIAALQNANGGINRGRRLQEAALAQSPSSTPSSAAALAPQLIASAAQQSAATGSSTTSNSTTVNIGDVTVHTKATDGAGVARDLGGQLKREMAVQANTGLG